MGKNKKKQKKDDSVISQVTAPLRGEIREKARRFNWKLLVIVLINTVLIYGFYRLAMGFSHFKVVLGIYIAVTTALVLAYVIYNRGFTRKNVTRDMLPDTMTDEEKDAYLADGEQRLKKSKWMLTLIFPLILTFLFDSVELFLGDYFKNLFQ